MPFKFEKDEKSEYPVFDYLGEKKDFYLGKISVMIFAKIKKKTEDYIEVN